MMLRRLLPGVRLLPRQALLARGQALPLSLPLLLGRDGWCLHTCMGWQQQEAAQVGNIGYGNV
jgi:hypothetical protein